MIPTEQPGRQMAGMLRHLRATPLGQDYFEIKTAPGFLNPESDAIPQRRVQERERERKREI